jgi:hypothetical protein
MDNSQGYRVSVIRKIRLRVDKLNKKTKIDEYLSEKLIQFQKDPSPLHIFDLEFILKEVEQLRK